MSNYKKISPNIESIIVDNPKEPGESITWININNAGKKEIEFLRKEYSFDLKHLQSSFGYNTAQRPFTENGRDYLFLVLHFPFFSENSVVAGEVNFFIGHGYMVTLHNNNIAPLREFFGLCKKGERILLTYKSESSAVLLYELLERLMFSSYKLLDQNGLEIDKVEKIIFNQNQKEAASQLLLLKRNIINLRKILQNHKNILKSLTEMKSSLVPEKELKKYYNRLVEHSKRIWEFLDSQKEMVDALQTSNESLLNYRISDIMKTLTIFSVIVFPLTLLAAIFGMNAMNGMPFIQSEHSFWIIISIMLISSLFMLLFFEKKKWL